MTKEDFVIKTVGIPWENRASSFESCDCFGLVKLYYKHVLGYTISEVKGYEQGGDFQRVVDDNIDLQWSEVDNYQDGAMAIFYTHGEPKHIALCIGGAKFLHSHGSINRAGKVEVVKMRALKKLYNDVTYHRLQAF